MKRTCIVFTLLLFLGACFLPAETGTARPWLAKEPANVLLLDCHVPFGTFTRNGWSSVESIEVKFQSPSSQDNETLVSIARNSQPQKGPQLPQEAELRHFMGKDHPDDPRLPFLSVVMPIDEDLLGQYFCVIRGIIGSSYTPTLTFAIDINRTVVEQSVQISNHSFSAKALRADKVTVTWSAPQTPEVKVYSYGVGLDSDGNVKDSSRYLLRTLRTESGEVEHRAPGTLLARLSDSSAKNYTAYLYTATEVCQPYCWYRCQIPHASCSPEDDGGCTCEGPGVRPSVSERECPDCDYTGYIVGIVLLFVFFIFLQGCVVVLCIHQRGVLCGKKFVKNFVCCPKPRPDFSNLVDRVIENGSRPPEPQPPQVKRPAHRPTLPPPQQGQAAASADPPADQIHGIQQRPDDGDVTLNRNGVLERARRGGGGGEDLDTPDGQPGEKEPLMADVEDGEQPKVADQKNHPDLQLQRDEIDRIAKTSQQFRQQLQDVNRNNTFMRVVTDAPDSKQQQQQQQQQPRLICESDDIVVLFDCKESSVVYWFCKDKNTMIEDERKLLSKVRSRERARRQYEDEMNAATEKLQSLVTVLRTNAREVKVQKTETEL